ncbi:ecotropic viral integration site 5 protein homolog isoform X4 [Cajanus cajan]|uniref:ecotropic viral integration site 5 protein homolog isoform X4 n=1 Tax=Cajanus cajan TaxID=3821 RepID=UPI00098D80C0|nr:ecotropic viral integration site 5 protein homolog isoform X4 [Cajanus cajan]
MAHFTFNLLHYFEPKRDSYGFALRPQYAQRYKEYSYIYREEEDERSDKWSDFLEQLGESSQPTFENEHEVTLNAEPGSNKVKEERNPHRLSNGDDSSRRNFSDLEEETNVVRVSEVLEKGDSSDRTTSGGTEIKEGTSPERVSEGDDSSGRNFTSDSTTGNNSGKDLHHSEDRKTRKVQHWAEIRPSLTAIEETLSSRVKKRKTMQGAQINDQDLPEHFSRWKELESLVQGGVPKDLRGEVWQAFVGVKTRRVESYYEDLLARDESEEQDVPSAAFGKWKKQIEKDLPRTFPGHPALDENGRNSLRRLLLAYARYNPTVGYCQAMNFFAGLLLLLMPEENAFWAFVGIIDDYFEGYYTEDMIESQVDQLIFEELVRERFPKLVNHLDYLGVQVAWISGPWFLSIFVNIIPWESVLRVWDVLLFQGNRVMLFRTALTLMELYGPALITTKDAGDAITLLQSLTGSTFDSSQLVFTACMGYLNVTEARLRELREKHLPSVLGVIEERSKKGRVWKDSKGLATKLYSFKHDRGSLVEERKGTEGSDTVADGNVQLESHSSNFDELLNSLNVDSELDALPDLQDQVVWLKVELCRLLEEKRSAILRAEELETAFMEMVKEDNRLELSARVEQLEKEVAELQHIIADKKEQEAAMMQVLMRLEQDQKVTEEARRRAEQDLAAQKFEVHALQEKYEKAMQSVAEMQKRVVMAESMLEATLQYESGQSKALSSPRAGRGQSPRSDNSRKIGLLSFGLGWRDKNKGKPNAEESSQSVHNNGSPGNESDNQESDR